MNFTIGDVSYAVEQELRRSHRENVSAELVKCVERYNEAWSELATLRSKMFPPYSPVNVDCGRYVGPGKVVNDASCPIEKLPVRIENGNVWWYPLVACSPTEKPI